VSGSLITNSLAKAGFAPNDYFRPVDMNTWQANSIADLDVVASGILSKFPHEKIFAFFGEMGAGKTTFIKSICKVLDVTDNVSSPTFALVNEYATRDGKVVYHFDFYRIENEQEAIDIGTRDYFGSGNLCLVEWPEKILHLLPEDALKIHISVTNETRIITTDNG
jgi:tRNA threonylcarbamoyladenosine biosynthesis protein TsaE